GSRRVSKSCSACGRSRLPTTNLYSISLRDSLPLSRARLARAFGFSGNHPWVGAGLVAGAAVVAMTRRGVVFVIAASAAIRAAPMLSRPKPLAGLCLSGWRTSAAIGCPQPLRSRLLEPQCLHGQAREVGNDAVHAEIGQATHQGRFVDRPHRHVQALALCLEQ